MGDSENRRVSCRFGKDGGAWGSRLDELFETKKGLPPDFLWGLVALAKFMRLSLLKAAGVAIRECHVAGNPGRPSSSTHVVPRLRPTARRGRRCKHRGAPVQEVGLARGSVNFRTTDRLDRSIHLRGGGFYGCCRVSTRCWCSPAMDARCEGKIEEAGQYAPTHLRVQYHPGAPGQAVTRQA